MTKMKVRIELECELEGIALRDSGLRETQEKRELERDIEKYIDYIRKNKLVTAGMHFPGNGVKDSL